MVLNRPFHKLRSQLIFAFLAAFLGFSIAVGLPMLLVINRQASSQAQLLLDQAIVASKAFLEGEQSDLQSLALVVSQRPTLKQLLEAQDFSSLESYLGTLRDSANLDLIRICLDGKELIGVDRNLSRQEFCQLSSPSGYLTLSSGNVLYLYASGTVSSDQQHLYTVIVAKNIASTLTELQKETNLLYFLMGEDRIIASSDPALEIRPSLTEELIQRSNQNANRSLPESSLRIGEHQYILSNLEVAPSLQFHLVSALNVDDQIAVQQNLSRTLMLGLLFIVFVASMLGIWFSQRISRPIVDLANAAAKFRQGNLDSPVSIQSPVWEIDQLANTLEDGRVALQHSLQQLQAEKAWIEHLLNSIVEGMLTLNHENRITFASAGTSKITGIEVDQMIGQRIEDIFLPPEGEVNFSRQLPAIG